MKAPAFTTAHAHTPDHVTHSYYFPAIDKASDLSHNHASNQDTPMQLAQVPAHDLAAAVARHHKEHRFLAAIENPLTGRIALYGTNTAQVDALIEAKTDYPKGEIRGQWEYLAPEFIRELRTNALRRDPVAAALKHLGQIDPSKLVTRF